MSACTDCQTVRSAARISCKEGPRRDWSHGTDRANDKNLSLNRLITRRCTFSSMDRAVAWTERALRTVGSIGPELGAKAVGPGDSSSASRKLRSSCRSVRGRRASCQVMASASVQRERQGSHGDAPVAKACCSADKSSGAGIRSGVRSSPG